VLAGVGILRWSVGVTGGAMKILMLGRWCLLHAPDPGDA